MYSVRSQLRSLSNEGNDRVARVVDSIANISISQTKDEVVAVAVQIRTMDIRLIVASNGTLPNSTTTYLGEIWNILKQLSKDYQDAHHRMSKLSILPKRPPTKDLSEDARRRVQNLRQKILRFGHQNLRLRVSKHYSSIISINRDVAKELGLEPMIKQLKIIKSALDLPALADKIWNCVWIILESIRFRFDEFSSSIRNIENTPLIPFPLFRYLSKVVSASRDIKVLMNAAYSTRLRALFHRDFQIINLNGSGYIPLSLPRSRARWTQLVENILRWHNMTAKENGEVMLKLDEVKVQQYVVKMCERPIFCKIRFVHCELNIVSYILQSSEQGFLDDIGVSKLSCTGCAQFIQAVEHVSGKRFKVKGTDQKFDYPWVFPNIPHNALESVAERMRETISFTFGQTYEGFHPETKPDLSESNDDDDDNDQHHHYYNSRVEGSESLDAAITHLIEVSCVSENMDSGGRRKK